MTALRRLDRPIVACALAALLNLLAWSLLTPPFHVPDELAHFAYAQTLAETGSPPVTKPTTVYSPEELTALQRTYFFAVIGQARDFPASLPSEQRDLDRALAANPGRTGNGDANVATAQPPLFYALQDVPYAVGSHGSIFTRLALMRVVSCLFGVLTVLFCFAFVREVLPGSPWAAAVGALAVAFQPMFAFISSGMNPDALLFAAAAALFWAVARAFRRGLTLGRATAVGAALVIGALSKLNFLGLMPGVLAALAYLAWRDRGRPGRAPAGAALAVAVLALPLAAYAALNVAVWDRPALGLGEIGTLAQPGTGSGHAQSLGGLLSYTWQLYLPRGPGMLDWFPGYLPLRSLWLNGLVGRFGWLDYGLPGWAYTVAPWVTLVGLGLAVAGALRSRLELPRRAAELGAYALMTAGLLFIVARSGYQARVDRQPTFEQARYLLPLLAPYAALVALASRALGRRWGPALGAFLVVVAAGHNVFAGLVTLARYYG